MTYVPLAFAPAPPTDSPAPTYSLLTLPPALLALLSSSDASSSPLLEIRGHTTDAAVLVTPDQTYTLRGVQNSNSLCLCSQVGGEGEGSKGWFAAEGAEKDEFDDEGELRGKRIEIETVLHETLEVLPSVARTERLPELLKGSEYRGEDAEAESSTVGGRHIFQLDTR